MRKIFYKAILFFIFLGLVVPISEAQTTFAPLPQIPPVPAKYRYPSLVCGKPLPVPSATALDKLSTLYKDCIASGCHQIDKYSASTVKNIATEVFQEPAAFIEKHEDIKSGYTIFCAFFGGDNLEYVNCNYVLSTVENTYEDNSCRVGNIDDGYTPVFGPNKATFILEQRTIPISKIPSLLGQYQTRGQNFVDQSYVQKLLFAPGVKIPGLIEGPVKVQMLQKLNCKGLTPTQSRTLVNIEPENRLPSATVIKQEAESASETLQETESIEITMSVSDTLSTSVTSSATPNADSESPSNIPSESLDVSRTLTSDKAAMPTANWSAASGVYEDATNQPNRYVVNDDVVTDTFSNLQWERAASNSTMSWSNATDYCADKTTGGHKGWRLPVVQELQSLVDYIIPYRGSISGINTIFFPKTPTSFFWSSFPVAGYPGRYWYVSYGHNACYGGLVYAHMAGWSNCSANTGYVRCVYGNVIPPFIDNRYDNTSTANVVKDLVTGLMWERYSSNSPMSWKNAITYCITQTTGGFSGWELPSIKELTTLVNYNITIGSSVTMNQEIFAGEPALAYWSLTPVSGISRSAWLVAFNAGNVYYHDMSRYNRVRCVCFGSNCLPIPIANWKAETGVYADATNQTGRYKVKDGVVTDTFTNLQWEQTNSTTPMPWSDANSYCANRTIGGHQGWRVPAVQELQSLVDYMIDWKGSNPGINNTAFPNTPLNYFWSSTTMSEGTPDQSWYVSFGENCLYSGLVYSSNWNNCGSDTGYVRCVYGKIIPPVTNNRYDSTSIPNVVKDLVTELMWERYASNSDLTWKNAITYCVGRNTGEFSGWRLPAVKELLTLLNYNITPDNLIMNKEVFAEEPIVWYWSSTPVFGGSGRAWNVGFNSGSVDGYDVGNYGRVRCVCSGSNCLPIANWKAETGVYADATNQTGRYRIEDGVVTDTFTNLRWEQAYSTTPMLWSDTNDYCTNRTIGGHQGWRVPAIQELQSLVDYTIDYNGTIPGINVTAFPKTPLNYFWSATPMAGGTPEQLWYVNYGKDSCSNCYSGLVYSQKWLGNHNVSSNGYVRCVYGNVIPPVTNNRYDSTSISNVVKDLIAGLMWERQASNSNMPWRNAITYCAAQNTGGFSGWRLPSVKELLTLLNYNIPPGSLIMNQEIFAGEPIIGYWSSTPVSGNHGGVWYVGFVGGSIKQLQSEWLYRVRCVCSSNCLPIANWNAETGVYADATNQTGRYKVEDGVVTDTFTNLQWEQAHSNTTYNWTYANNTYCQSQNTGGYTDWRLPTVLELQSLVDYTIPYKGDIAGINRTVFPNTPLTYFWSSVPVAGFPGRYWYLSYGKDICYGGLIHAHMADHGWVNCALSTNGYIRCIRAGGSSVIASRYDNSTTGIVKDRKTGFIWERQASNNMPWSEALTYCNNSQTGDKSGWHLPTIKELSTLLDHSVAPGGLIMDNTAFAGEPQNWFWSSSPVSGNAGHAWLVNFNRGRVGYGIVNDVYGVRCCVPDV